MITHIANARPTQSALFVWIKMTFIQLNILKLHL